jgi:hypothetical protein
MEYFGQQVLSINNLDPISYLESLSAIAGGYTQASTRIHEVVAAYSLDSNGYELSPGQMVNRRWPLESSIILEFTSGSVSFPVLSAMRSPGKWTDYASYLTAPTTHNPRIQRHRQN